MIDRLQQHLSDIYQVGGVHDVRDFLITDPRLARYIGAGSMLADTSETLLLAEDDEGLALSLFLDGELLARLESADPLSRLRPDQLDDLWKVFEGLSHFNCVAWKASRDRSVSLLELELQAEIDKFVGTTLLAQSQGRTEMLNSMTSSWRATAPPTSTRHVSAMRCAAGSWRMEGRHCPSSGDSSACR